MIATTTNKIGCRHITNTPINNNSYLKSSYSYNYNKSGCKYIKTTIENKNNHMRSNYIIIE